jgi:predicted flap endonuclease-1-like 5' DNA nuclease
MNSFLNVARQQTSPAQNLAGGAGLPAWAWFLIIVVIILLVWWLLVRSAEKQNEIQVPHETAHAPEPGEPQKSGSIEIVSEAASAVDDLTILEGIGPKVSQVLAAAGISSFAKLAETDVPQLKQILESEGYKYMDPGTWPEQARLLSEGKKDEFDLLVGSLKGGRKK